MKITCDNCGSTYRVDENKMKGALSRVTCKGCGNKIMVARPGDKPEHRVESLDFSLVGIDVWRVRIQLGLTYDFRDYKTLKSYMSSGKIQPGDKISYDGQTWVELGQISDLAGYMVDVYTSLLGGPGAGPTPTEETTEARPGLSVPEFAPYPQHGPDGSFEEEGAEATRLFDSFEPLRQRQIAQKLADNPELEPEEIDPAEGKERYIKRADESAKALTTGTLVVVVILLLTLGIAGGVFAAWYLVIQPGQHAAAPHQVVQQVVVPAEEGKAGGKTVQAVEPATGTDGPGPAVDGGPDDAADGQPADDEDGEKDFMEHTGLIPVVPDEFKEESPN